MERTGRVASRLVPIIDFRNFLTTLFLNLMVELGRWRARLKWRVIAHFWARIELEWTVSSQYRVMVTKCNWCFKCVVDLRLWRMTRHWKGNVLLITFYTATVLVLQHPTSLLAICLIGLVYLHENQTFDWNVVKKCARIWRLSDGRTCIIAHIWTR